MERLGAETLVEAAAGLLAAGARPDDLLDRLLDLVLEANGGDLSDDVALLCLARARPGPGGAEEDGRG